MISGRVKQRTSTMEDEGSTRCRNMAKQERSNKITMRMRLPKTHALLNARYRPMQCNAHKETQPEKECKLFVQDIKCPTQVINREKHQRSCPMLNAKYSLETTYQNSSSVAWCTGAPSLDPRPDINMPVDDSHFSSLDYRLGPTTQPALFV